jgi:hypothetical protein
MEDKVFCEWATEIPTELNAHQGRISCTRGTDAMREHYASCCHLFALGNLGDVLTGSSPRLSTSSRT